MTDLTKVVFDSSINYLKRSNTFTGSTSLTLPGGSASVTTTVTHNLGYVPLFHVSCDISNDGTIWYGNKVHEYTETSLSSAYPAFPNLKCWATTTTLSIQLQNYTSPTATGSRTVYWVIYLDYNV